jgi:hypothetical protein
MNDVLKLLSAGTTFIALGRDNLIYRGKVDVVNPLVSTVRLLDTNNGEYVKSEMHTHCIIPIPLQRYDSYDAKVTLDVINEWAGEFMDFHIALSTQKGYLC